MDQAQIRKLAEEYIRYESHGDFQQEVKDLLARENSDELFERFYTELEFGTGGIRGIMGGGYNRMNPLIVQRAVQGLSNYILQHGVLDKKGEKSVALAYDSRLNSALFARTAAEVFAGHGIVVYLFSSLRPTPELSFAIRHLGCTSGAVCTASHNPKKYNGFKVYWSDGAQIVAPHDKGIIDEVRKVRGSIKRQAYEEAVAAGSIRLIDEEVDQAYLSMLDSLVIRPEVLKKEAKAVKIVYTPLHGTGAYLLERALGRYGVSLNIVPEQREPDGNFPTVQFPNPEEASALEMAIQLAKTEGADLVIGTDPDADRVGLAVRQGNDFVLLNGNQHGVLLTDYIFSARKETGKLPARPAFVNTIVSTDLQRRIAASYGVEVYQTLTGFKWIASMIRQFEQAGSPQYVFGCEESYGFMIGDRVRDKDAISAVLLTVEMTLYHKSQGRSLLDRLEEIWTKFGYYEEINISRTFEGSRGKEIMARLMANLREHPVAEIAGQKVLEIRDIDQGSTSYPQSGESRKNIELPKSDVLQWILEDGSVISARPSGTEPKIKFYASVAEVAGMPSSEARLKVSEKMARIEDFINSRIKAVS